MKFEIGQLVENYACGFGRVIGFLSNDAVVVRFSYLPYDDNERIFGKEIYHMLTIYEEK